MMSDAQEQSPLLTAAVIIRAIEELDAGHPLEIHIEAEEQAEEEEEGLTEEEDEEDSFFKDDSIEDPDYVPYSVSGSRMQQRKRRKQREEGFHAWLQSEWPLIKLRLTRYFDDVQVINNNNNESATRLFAYDAVKLWNILNNYRRALNVFRLIDQALVLGEDYNMVPLMMYSQQRQHHQFHCRYMLSVEGVRRLCMLWRDSKYATAESRLMLKAYINLLSSKK
jgi:hypothetical protein